MEHIEIRPGTIDDIPAIYGLIKELAEFEKCPDDVAVTIDELKKDGFGSSPEYGFYVGTANGEVVAMALYYYCYSTWRGKYLYLEDLIVRNSHRQHGIGSLLFDKLVEKCQEENLRQMGWQVLDWNESAIKFYKKHNANLDEEWLNGRLYF